jgi:hypothetical protein
MLKLRVTCGAAVLALVGAASAYAQTPGMICGTATDSAGAKMAGVTVTLASRAEEPATTKTSATGEYLFPKVAIGTYSLSFTLDGFKKTVRSGVVIGTGLELRIDQQLERSLLSKEEVAAPAASVAYDRAPATGGTFTRQIVTSQRTPPQPCGAPR